MENHLNNLIFIGGIHGAGKQTICEIVCAQTKLVHITASEVLKWDEISRPENKKVVDIQNTQYRLITGLSKVLNRNEEFLLDGHFCLFNSGGHVEKVPMETFEKIAPKLIVVVTTDVALIKQRLKKRDNRRYKLDVLRHMQEEEKKYAKRIALKLSVPFIEIKDGNSDKLIKLITNQN